MKKILVLIMIIATIGILLSVTKYSESEENKKCLFPKKFIMIRN